jgi:cytochrome c
LTVLFAFAGCQPDAQQSPAAPPAPVAQTDAQEKPMPTTVAPAPQKAPAKIVVAAPNVQPAQPKPATGKSDVASPPQEVQMAEPAKAETIVAMEQVPAATPAPQGRLSEADALALAKKKNCFACHALDKKAVGPAWRAVAQKYRGDAGAQAVLEAKVRKGGKGNWGSIAMPPQPALSDEELSGLVQFVLQLQ